MAKGRPTGSGVLEESGSEQGSQEGEGPELNGDDPIFSSANGLGIPVVNLAPTTTVSEVSCVCRHLCTFDATYNTVTLSRGSYRGGGGEDLGYPPPPPRIFTTKF